MPAKKAPVDPAIALIRGTRGLSAQIAKELGIKRMAVYQWRRVPSDRVNAVARLIGRSPNFIRPDLYKRGQ